jgi:hypothetical protein
MRIGSEFRLRAAGEQLAKARRGELSRGRPGPQIGGPILHHRQLVVGPEPFGAELAWRSVQLDAGTWVSHCAALRSGTARDADGVKWVLLGLATQTRADAPSPLDQIAAARSSAVPELYADWAGRWLLVGGGGVHLDASGLLGCFYGKDASGRAWASSSPALIEDAISPACPLPRDPRPLIYERGLSWFVPPRSGLEGVRRLLPSQVLDLGEGHVRPRPLLPPIDPGRGYGRTLELLGDALVVAMQRLPPTPKPLWLLLSSGLDSRIVLAAAERAGIPFVPFTRISTRMSPGDRLIPPQLARALGRDLVVHRQTRRRRRKLRTERLPLVVAHSAGHVSEEDAQPLLHGTRDRLEGIAAGGVAFGVGKALERGKLPPYVGDPAESAGGLAELLGEQADSTGAAGLREWLEWVVRTPQDNLDWRDRFYIEQRLSGWQSSKEQVYDMVPLERFHPINSARCYALLLEIDESIRHARRHQRDLVEQLCPALAGYPWNPSARELGVTRVAAVKLRDHPAALLRLVWRRMRQQMPLRHGSGDYRR